MASGFGTESWGIGPFTFVLNVLIYTCGMTLNASAFSLVAVPTDASPLRAGLTFESR